MRLGSGFRWTPAFGEQQSLHVSRVLKNTGALQRLASRGTMGHCPRLLQRRQRLEMQIPRGLSFALLPLHSKRLGGGIIVCLSDAGRWNPGFTDSSGTKLHAGRFQFWRCHNEQREAPPMTRVSGRTGDRTSRLTSPGKGIRRRSSGRELQNPIWKSGMRPTPISRRGAMHGDIADA